MSKTALLHNTSTTQLFGGPQASYAHLWFDPKEHPLLELGDKGLQISPA
jgi:hypothetical protein